MRIQPIPSGPETDGLESVDESRETSIPSSASQRAALTAAGLTKHYGDVTAVADVGFSLAEGEFLTLLGPSGSGKTTTLRLIAGFLRADSGQLLMSGRDISDVPPHRRNIGMVFQNYALFPHMTALRNVAFPLEMRGLSRRRARSRVLEMLELVGLERLENRYPREMSGGQQQRVALARALVFHPALLLMDEPFGALDRKLRGQMQIELLRIAKQTGATVISVTHDQEEALAMSDRIAIYNHGRIEQLGTAPDLYERPASVFVADFVGESNILRGKVETTGSGARVTGDGWMHGPLGSELALRPAGTPLAVVIRPECLRLLSGDTRAVGPNRCRATVGEAIYLGAEWKYIVILADASAMQIRLRRQDAGAPVAPGESVEIYWRPEDAVVLDDSPAEIVR